jgi:glutaredoxin 3
MADVVVYSKDYCPYCVKAKGLLTRKGIGFKEIDGVSIGGCDDLYALDTSGKLDKMLAA